MLVPCQLPAAVVKGTHADLQPGVHGRGPPPRGVSVLFVEAQSSLKRVIKTVTTRDEEVVWHEGERRAAENRTTRVIPLMVAAWATFLLPGSLVDALSAKLSAVESVSAGLSAVPSMVAAGGGATVIALFLQWLLVESDPLLHGESAAARWFRNRFPMTQWLDAHPEVKSAMDPDEARNLWFEIFDGFARTASGRRRATATYAATYYARFVWRSQRLLWLLSALGLGSMLLHGLGGLYDGAAGLTLLLVHGLSEGLTVGGAIILSLSNRIGPRPTGCWARVDAEFGRQRAMLTEIISDSEDATALRERVRLWSRSAADR